MARFLVQIISSFLELQLLSSVVCGSVFRLGLILLFLLLDQMYVSYAVPSVVLERYQEL